MNFTAKLTKIGLIGIAFTLPLLSFTPIAEANRCHIVAEDWDGSVDVRSQPRRHIFNIIATVPNGTHLDVIGRSSDWLEVYIPDYRLSAHYQTGWVRERATRRICSRGDRAWSSRPSRSDLPPLPPLPPLSSDWESDWEDEYDY